MNTEHPMKRQVRFFNAVGLYYPRKHHMPPSADWFRRTTGQVRAWQTVPDVVCYAADVENRLWAGLGSTCDGRIGRKYSAVRGRMDSYHE